MKKRTLFRIAVAVHNERVGGYTAKDFAEDHDVSATVLYEVLRGRTTSARLDSAINAFISDQLAHLRQTSALVKAA